MRCRKCDSDVRAWRFAFEVYWRMTVLGFCNCGEACYDSHESWDIVNLHNSEAAAVYRYGMIFPIQVVSQRKGGGVQLSLPFKENK
jgi:hypothetical protein